LQTKNCVSANEMTIISAKVGLNVHGREKISIAVLYYNFWG